MKVSIQIPTYNQPGLLLRAVNSALAQDYPDTEVVVCDDGSMGDPLADLRNLDSSRVKIFSNEKNLGRVANYRHLLYDLVSGSWVANLDADDFYSDSFFVSRAINLIRIYDDVVLYMGNIRNLKKISGKCSSAVMLDPNHLMVDGLEYLKNYSAFPGFRHFACLYKRSVAVSSDFYSIDSLNNDFTSMMKLAVQGKVILSSCSVGQWNQNDSSASNNMDIGIYHQMNQRSLHDLASFIQQKFDKKTSLSIEKKLFDLQEYYKGQVVILKSGIGGSIAFLLRNPGINRLYWKLWVFFIWKKLFSLFVGK